MYEFQFAVLVDLYIPYDTTGEIVSNPHQTLGQAINKPSSLDP